MVYRAAIKTGVIFKDAKNKEGAKKFVAFMLDEANPTPYVEGALGRWFPVPKTAQQSAFWKADPHRLAVYNQFMNGTTPFEFTKNFKFTVLNNENVWAKAMNRVLNGKVPVDKAVDEMIARIKVVWREVDPPPQRLRRPCRPRRARGPALRQAQTARRLCLASAPSSGPRRWTGKAGSTART